MKRRIFLGLCGVSIGAVSQPSLTSAQTSKKRNVLFIAVDDLRPELNCYGKSHIKSPNIDRLAKSGTLFKRAYVQQAVCSPSRVSVLTGLRPESAGVINLTDHFRDTAPDVITLPQHFKSHGYHTESIGKIFHKSTMQDDKNSWSVPSRRGGGKGNWQTKEAISIRKKLIADAKQKGLKGKKVYYATLGPPTDDPDNDDSMHGDGAATNLALQSLQSFAEKDQPFFLAVGFIKPHLPFSCPKKYWDLYDRDEIKLSPNKNWPKDSPSISHMTWGELRNYHDMPMDKKQTVSDEQAKKLIHGYYACVSFMDAQVGKLLDELDRLKLRKNTTIVLWGDHGWKLGDYSAWCKHSAYEIDTHAPLIISDPALPKNQKSDSLVEMLDIYPTLAALCKLPVPKHCEGKNLTPILKNPKTELHDAAYSIWPKNSSKIIGYSIRTNEWRYTEWIVKRKNKLEGKELYDHRKERVETVNLVNQPEHAAVAKQLSKKLKVYFELESEK